MINISACNIQIMKSNKLQRCRPTPSERELWSQYEQLFPNNILQRNVLHSKVLKFKLYNLFFVDGNSFQILRAGFDRARLPSFFSDFLTSLMIIYSLVFALHSFLCIMQFSFRMDSLFPVLHIKCALVLFVDKDTVV